MTVRNEIAVRVNDQIDYRGVGRRVRGSFRGALRDYGLSRGQIDRVIADIDCGREVAVQIGSHTHYFIAL